MDKTITAYSIVAVAEKLRSIMYAESKRIISELYSKEPDEIIGTYERFTRSQEPIHDESINIPGNGEVVDGYTTSHVTLLHYVSLGSDEEAKEYKDKVIKKIEKSTPPSLVVQGTGHRTSFSGQPYTCYLTFEPNDAFVQFRQKTLDLSKGYINEHTQEEYLSINYFPHSTIMYDDVDPEKVERAENMVNMSLIQGKEFAFDRFDLEKATLDGDSFKIEVL